jgi:phenylalanyl-tRNA synthetase beta chain
VLDASTDTGAKNKRKIAAMVCDQSSNFEVIHGLLDLLMTKVGCKMGKDYRLVEDSTDVRYFTRRGVAIMLNGKQIGSMGVLHPEVLGNFELKYPVSCVEVEFDPMFDHFKNAK